MICFIGAAALAGALLCEKKCSGERQTPGYSDDMILSLPYFDIIAPKGENRGLPFDVESYCLGDRYIHLVLPGDVNRKALTVYIRDSEGNYLAKRVYDMTGKVMIGPWELTADQHELPVMCFQTGDHEIYDMMNASDEKDIICDGNMQIFVSKKDMQENGWYREYLSTSEDRSKKTTASLQGRGNDSWGSNRKKSYTLRLGKAQNLLGMGKNKSWNLIGNAYDKSLIKNLVFNELSERSGIEYQPQMRNIVLYVDGRYEGVYTLTTKVSVDRNRVDLKKGDLFYKMDPPEADQPIRYESKTWFEDGLPYPLADLKYPENASPETIEEASSVLQRFIDAVEDPSCPDIEEVADIDSLIRYYWIEEASMNFDAWQRSVYMYYSRSDGKIHMGPVWDMDRSLGSPYDKQGMLFDTPQGWRVRNAGWYSMLFENDGFRKQVADTYFNGGIREELLDGISLFEEKKNRMGEDGRLNYLFFAHANDIGAPDIFGDAPDYDSYCDRMIGFYRERVEWIDKAMMEEAK